MGATVHAWNLLLGAVLVDMVRCDTGTAVSCCLVLKRKRDCRLRRTLVLFWRRDAEIYQTHSQVTMPC